MQITKITAYQVDLPLHEGSYKWSGGKSVTTFDSTVVAVETDSGLTGYGEVCPLGPFYLPAYASGARAGIVELGQHLIGEDPTQLGKLNQLMDAALKEHAYVKSAIDIACWDILGQVAGLPICDLLGGRYGDDFVLYRAISQVDPQAMAENVAAYRAEGYRRFQLKVGGDPNEDIERIHAVAAVRPAMISASSGSACPARFTASISTRRTSRAITLPMRRSTPASATTTCRRTAGSRCSTRRRWKAIRTTCCR